MLAGDAAHAMSPCESFNFLNEILIKGLTLKDRGQDVNNSIQDAANYVTAMKKIRDGEDTKADY